MESAVNLTGVAVIALAATLCGIALVRYKQPAIIGYILAGAILGPGGLGLAGNRESIAVLAELGVILLLYFVGMELSLSSFRKIWRISIFTASAQIGLAVAIMILAGYAFGWTLANSLLFGFCLAISSTAVAIKVLENMDALHTDLGRLTIGILIAQDLAVAPMLLLISGMKDGGISIWAPIEISISIGILVGVIMIMTKRSKINMPFHHIWVERKDLAPLGALTWCFVFSGTAGLIGLSPAFGAFLAGLIVGNSAQREQMHNGAGPIQTVLMMVFFLSIGMLVDFGFILDYLPEVVFFCVFVLCFKTGLNIVLLRLQGQSWQQSFESGLLLGQLGEFSFVLAAAAVSADILDQTTHKMIVAVTVLSLTTSPLFTNAAQRLNRKTSWRGKGLLGTIRLIYSAELRVSRRVAKILHVVLKIIPVHLLSWIKVLKTQLSRFYFLSRTKRASKSTKQAQDILGKKPRDESFNNTSDT